MATMKKMQITSDEFDAFVLSGNDMLSDIDYGYNRENGKWDVPSIEWDGMYGKHWSQYTSEEAREKALNVYQKNLNKWVLNYREVIANENARKKADQKRIAELKTLGGQFPEIWKVFSN